MRRLVLFVPVRASAGTEGARALGGLEASAVRRTSAQVLFCFGRFARRRALLSELAARRPPLGSTSPGSTRDPLLLRASLAHAEPAATEQVTVQCCNRPLGVRGTHVYEGEPARLACSSVLRGPGDGHPAVRVKQLAKVDLGCDVRQVPDVNPQCSIPPIPRSGSSGMSRLSRFAKGASRSPRRRRSGQSRRRSRGEVAKKPTLMTTSSVAMPPSAHCAPAASAMSPMMNAPSDIRLICVM